MMMLRLHVGLPSLSRICPLGLPAESLEGWGLLSGGDALVKLLGKVDLSRTGVLGHLGSGDCPDISRLRMTGLSLKWWGDSS